jgi:hypothetical protein
MHFATVRGDDLVMPALFVLNFLAAGYASARGRWHFRALVGLVIGAVVVAYVVPYDGVSLAKDAIVVLAYLAFFTGLMAHVQRAKAVTSEELFAALTGYLFLIMLFNALYSMVAIAFPGSFEGTPDLAAHRHVFIYFSMVTQTTLGYGDIHPVSPPARILAGLQAIVGQLYLAGLVARLVALQLMSKR